MAECTACDLVLDDPRARATHVDVACVMYTHKCKISGETPFVVVRDRLTLKLTCWCAGGSCGKTFDRIRDMRLHLKHAVGPWRLLANRPVTPPPLAPAVRHEPEEDLLQNIMPHGSGSLVDPHTVMPHGSVLTSTVSDPQRHIPITVDQGDSFHETGDQHPPSESHQSYEGESLPQRVPATSLVPNAYLESIGLLATTWKGLVCMSCRVSYDQRRMYRHLRDSPVHKNNRPPSDTALYNQALHICGIGDTLPPVPSKLGPPLAGLPCHKGYGCHIPNCMGAAPTLEALRQHYLSHDTPMPSSPSECSYQFYHNGADPETRRRFQVEVPKDINIVHRTILETTVEDVGRRLKEALEVPVPSDDIRAYHPFILRLGWYDIVRGKDAKALHETVLNAGAFPGLNELALRWLRSISDLQHYLDHNTLKRLNSKNEHELNHDQFVVLINESSIKAYASTLACFLAMLLRDQGEWRTPFQAELHTALDVLKDSLLADGVPSLGLVDDILTQIWRRPWTSTPANRHPDPTMRYAILQLLNNDGSFSHLRSLTPLLAQFTYLIRSFYIRVMTDGPTNPRPTYEDIRLWVLEGYSSSFDTVNDLQHRATAIVLSTRNPSDVLWVDPDETKTMLYKGDKISLAELQSMFRHIEEDTKQLFEELIFDPNLRVEYDLIYEDPCNRTLNYSFLSDSRNDFERHQTTLLNHILHDPGLFARFCYLTDGRLIWNKVELHKWLQRYAELSGRLLLLLDTLSGGPIRGRELTGMLYRTTQGQSLRNLVANGKILNLLRTHGKTSLRDADYRIVPHAINAFTASILTQDLVILRPFATFAILACYPDRSDLLTTYQYQLFVNQDRSFETGDISQLLAYYSLQHLGCRLTIRSFRHVAIAFRRLLCPRDTLLLDDGGTEASDDHVAAEQTGHTARTERSKYAITPAMFTGYPEDILPRFNKASQRWQQAMHVVPAGLHCNGRTLSYLETSSTQFDALVASGLIVPYQICLTQQMNADAIAKAVCTMVQPMLHQISVPPPPPLDLQAVADLLCATMRSQVELMITRQFGTALASLKPTSPSLDVAQNLGPSIDVTLGNDHSVASPLLVPSCPVPHSTAPTSTQRTQAESRAAVAATTASPRRKRTEDLSATVISTIVDDSSSPPKKRRRYGTSAAHDSGRLPETTAFGPCSDIPSSTAGIERVLYPAFGANAPLSVTYNDEPGGLFTRVMLERPPNEPLLPPVLRAPSAHALERRGVPASTAQSMLDSIYVAQVDRSAAIASLLTAQDSYYDMVNNLESSGHSQDLLYIPDSEFGPYSISEVTLGKRRAV